VGTNGFTSEDALSGEKPSHSRHILRCNTARASIGSAHMADLSESALSLVSLMSEFLLEYLPIVILFGIASVLSLLFLLVPTHSFHHLRYRSRLSFSLCGHIGHDHMAGMACCHDFPRGTGRWPCLCVENWRAGLGIGEEAHGSCQSKWRCRNACFRSEKT